MQWNSVKFFKTLCKCHKTLRKNLLECRDEILVFLPNLRYTWLLFSIMSSLHPIYYQLVCPMNTMK